MSTEITPGSLLKDDIEVVSLMSECGGVRRYIAMHPKQRGHLLVHVLKRPSEEEKALLAIRELEHAATVRHRAFSARYGVDGNADQLYFVEGMPVGEVLGEMLEDERRPPLPYVARRLLQLLDALVVAHEAGCWHGALDPHCILLEQAESRSENLLVLGLGAASALKGSGGGPISDRRFVSAEALERGHPEPQDDVFAVAALCLAMISGLSSLDDYAGGLPNELRSHPLAGLLERALSGDPKQRYASVAEFRKAAGIAESLSHELLQPSPSSDDFDGFAASLSTVLAGSDASSDSIPEPRGDEEWLKLLPSSGAGSGALATLEAELAFSGLRDEAVRELFGEEVDAHDNESTTVSGPPDEPAERGKAKAAPEITVRTSMATGKPPSSAASSKPSPAREEVTAKTGAGLLKKGKKKKKGESSMPRGVPSDPKKGRPLGLRPDADSAAPASGKKDSDSGSLPAVEEVVAAKLELFALPPSETAAQPKTEPTERAEDEERTLIGPPPSAPQDAAASASEQTSDEPELDALTTSELSAAELDDGSASAESPAELTDASAADSFEEFEAPQQLATRDDPLPSNEVRLCEHTLLADIPHPDDPEEDFPEDEAQDAPPVPVLRPAGVQPVLLKAMLAAIILLAVFAVYLWATLDPKKTAAPGDGQTGPEQRSEPEAQPPRPDADATEGQQHEQTDLQSEQPPLLAPTDADLSSSVDSPTPDTITESDSQTQSGPETSSVQPGLSVPPPNSSKEPKQPKKNGDATKTPLSTPGEAPELLNIKID